MDNPFFDEETTTKLPGRKGQPCPRCNSSDVVVDYGRVIIDEPDRDYTKDTPFECWDCGNRFLGVWADELENTNDN